MISPTFVFLRRVLNEQPSISSSRAYSENFLTGWRYWLSCTLPFWCVCSSLWFTSYKTLFQKFQAERSPVALLMWPHSCGTRTRHSPHVPEPDAPERNTVSSGLSLGASKLPPILRPFLDTVHWEDMGPKRQLSLPDAPGSWTSPPLCSL